MVVTLAAGLSGDHNRIEAGGVAMVLTVSEEIFRSTRLTEAELQAELAIALFQQERLTLGQAAILAGLPQLDFQRLLAGRRIPLHYDLEAMEQDLKRAKGLADA